MSQNVDVLFMEITNNVHLDSAFRCMFPTHNIDNALKSLCNLANRFNRDDRIIFNNLELGSKLRLTHRLMDYYKMKKVQNGTIKADHIKVETLEISAPIIQKETKEQPMNNLFNKVIDNATFICGIRIDDASKMELLDLIKKLKEQKSALKDIDVSSNTITKQIDEIDKAIKLVVEQLDSN